VDEENNPMSTKPLFARTGILALALGLCFIGADKAAADLSPATGPAARGYAGLSYDEGENLVVMTGGLDRGGDWKGLDDVWVFDPEAKTWELVGDLQGLLFESMVYDSRAGKLIAYVFARYNPNSNYPWGPVDLVSETWSYDVSTNTWENLNPPGPIRPPEGLNGARLAYDAESGVVILHGGLSLHSFSLSNETWAYDYASNTWTNMKPKRPPAGRNFHGLTYDAAADRVLSIGGLNNRGGNWSITNDVFAYDYNQNAWTQLDSGNAPARDYVSAHYVPSTGRVILFGGATYDVDLDPGLNDPIPNDDTWEFDYFSNTWTLLEPRKSPSPRIWHATTATDRGLVLFGGGETRDTPTDETWLFNAKNHQWKKEGAARGRR
jgi:N-acetylneuraminic acid mutarotase